MRLADCLLVTFPAEYRLYPSNGESNRRQWSKVSCLCELPNYLQRLSKQQVLMCTPQYKPKPYHHPTLVSNSCVPSSQKQSDEQSQAIPIMW